MTATRNWYKGADLPCSFTSDDFTFSDYSAIVIYMYTSLTGTVLKYMTGTVLDGYKQATLDANTNTVSWYMEGDDNKELKTGPIYCEIFLATSFADISDGRMKSVGAFASGLLLTETKIKAEA